MDEISESLLKGTITPTDALDAFDIGDTSWVGEIPLDSVKVEVMDCGFESLNERLVFKKQRGDLIVLGAYQSHGKSAFMMQVCSHISLTSGPVLVFSTE